jgi:hypothetical protein
VARGFKCHGAVRQRLFGSCSTISGRQGILHAASTSSAIAKLCARPTAQGHRHRRPELAHLSVLAKNYDSRVQASMGQGTGSTYTVAYNLESCMANGKHAQPGDRIRIINGERDMFVGGTEAIARSQAELVTGLKCTGRQSCFRSNGSGWYVVNLEVADLVPPLLHGQPGYAGVQCRASWGNLL